MVGHLFFECNEMRFVLYRSSLFVKVDIDDDLMRRIDIDGGWVGACEDWKDGGRVRGES